MTQKMNPRQKFFWRKTFLGKKCLKILFKKIFVLTMARLKIPVHNRRRLNVHAKVHSPISLSLLLQNQVEYAVTNQKPK